MKETTGQASDRDAASWSERQVEQAAPRDRSETTRDVAEAAARRRAAWAAGTDTAKFDGRMQSGGTGGPRLRRSDDAFASGPVASVLDLLPQAVFCLGDKARVLWMNAAARALVAANRGLRLYGGRLAAGGQAGQRTLAALVALTSSDGEARRHAGQSGRGLLLPLELSDGGKLALLARPVETRNGEQALAGARLLLFVSDPAARVAVPPEHLTQLYGLTRAEARVAAAVAGGRRLSDYAAQTGVSIDTVRSQLKRVLEKTGARSQTDLVRLIYAGIAALIENRQISSGE